jgi:formamidopyrimidine-DNA glycosylase
MPELPEVETVARGMDRQVRGREIASVWLGSKPEPYKSLPAAIRAALSGSRIEKVRRVGKHVVFDLTGPARTKSSRRPPLTGTIVRRQWLVHLGMSGQLLIADHETPLPNHTHARVLLDDGREIRFVDPRRFGRLAVLDLSEMEESDEGASESPGFRGSGREPLEIVPEDFRALFRGRKAPIKSALLNQKLLHGIGNIYADESLFRAGIGPRRLAGRLSNAELDRLRIAIQQVLQEAIRRGGSSISNYVDSHGNPGFFQLEHRVYGRAAEPCLICGTPIRRIVLGGRGTHFCPKCQSRSRS